MDAELRERAEELATQMAGQIRTQQDLSAMMRMMMKTVMERVLDEVSFTAADRAGEAIVVDAGFVERNVGDLARNRDLSRFIL